MWRANKLRHKTIESATSTVRQFLCDLSMWQQDRTLSYTDRALSAKRAHIRQYKKEMALLSRRKFALATAMLATGGIAVASQLPELVILVQYVVSERSAGRVEDALTSPLERIVSALPRVVSMASVTSSVSRGAAMDFEIHFEGGATSEDLVTVLSKIAQLEIRKDVRPTSVSVHLGPTRIDQDTGLLLR